MLEAKEKDFAKEFIHSVGWFDGLKNAITKLVVKCVEKMSTIADEQWINGIFNYIFNCD